LPLLLANATLATLPLLVASSGVDADVEADDDGGVVGRVATVVVVVVFVFVFVFADTAAAIAVAAAAVADALSSPTSPLVLPLTLSVSLVRSARGDEIDAAWLCERTRGNAIRSSELKLLTAKHRGQNEPRTHSKLL